MERALAAAEAAGAKVRAAVRSGDLAAVRAAAKAAAANWRGPALADLRAIPFALGEGERLDAWRLELQVEACPLSSRRGNRAAWLASRRFSLRACPAQPLTPRRIPLTRR